MLALKVIIGSTRPGRFSEKIVPWLTQELEKRSEFETEFLDLRDYPLPFYDQPISPSEITDGAYGSDAARVWAQKIKEADAYILITPEYNRGTSAILKNALDTIWYEWNDKPVGFVAYGNAGGARAVEQLRLTCIELQMAPVRRAVHIRDPWNLLDERGELKAGALDFHVKHLDQMLGQLAVWGEALKTARRS